MTKAIIFDMDGVLIDSYTAWFNRFNETLKHFNKPKISEEEFDKKVWAMSFNQTAKKYFQLPPEEIVKCFKEKFQEFEKEIDLYPNVKETLEKLKEKNLILTLATNTNHETAEKILKNLNIEKYFDLVLGGDDVKEGKPDPEILLKTIETLDLKKEEVLFIGDTHWDKEAADNANIKFIGLRTKGDIKIEDISELINIK